MNKNYKKQQEEYEKKEIDRMESIEQGIPKARTPPPTPNLGFMEYDDDDPKKHLWYKGFLKLWHIMLELKDPYDTPNLTPQKRIVLDALNNLFLQESYMSYDSFCDMIDYLLYTKKLDESTFNILQERFVRYFMILSNIYDKMSEEEGIEEWCDDNGHQLKARLYNGLKVFLLKEKPKIPKKEYFKVIEQLY